MNRRRLLAVLLTASLTAGLLAGGVATAGTAGAYPSANVELIRRGLGHGRGMSQWGALGYAVGSHWSATQILEHYYGGTTAGAIGNDTMTVQMSKFNDADTIVAQEKGQAVIEGVGGQWAAVRVVRAPGGLFNVETGPGCGGPWTAAVVQPSVRILPAAGPTDERTDMLQLCESNPVQNRWVRGNVLAVNAGGASGASDRITINELPMESYLKGVVPRESPASWGGLGGGRGQQALMAQAVAARSYSAASDVPGPAKACDTTACQVYGGRALQSAAGFTDLESASTSQAVDATAGQVRMKNGGVNRTEFSASTGGWTSRVEDGNPYGAVEDAGDGYCTAEVCNPFHEQRVATPVSAIETRYGIGTLQRVEVLARNGLGADGGRVTKLRFVFSGGERTFSGEEQVRTAMGVGSSWFVVTNPPASFPYHVVARDGGVFSFGGAEFHGSLPGIGIKTPARDITEGPGGGYWLLGEDGGVFSFDVPFYGSMGGQHLNSPVVGMQSSASRRGYWLVAGDGGIFSFGDAPFFGSTGNMRLNKPVVAMAPTGGGQGYWIVATDGGIFTFGDAPFLGSTGAMTLNQPVFAMAPTPSGNGYWLVARDGGIFTFGDATFQGSLPGQGILETAAELLPSPSGAGYLIVTVQGHVYAFGDAASGGGPADVGAGPSPVVGAGRAG